MKRYIKILIFCINVLVTLHLMSCKKDSLTINPNSTIVSGDVIVVDNSNWRESFVSYDSLKHTLRFKDNSELIRKIDVGSIIVSEAGSGLLRKVSSKVTENGIIVFNTTPATLTDVFSQAFIECSVTLSQENMSSFVVNENSKFEPTAVQTKVNGNASYSWNFGKVFESGVRINGNLGFSWNLVSRIKINWLKSLKEVHMGYNASHYSNMQVTVPGSLNVVEEEDLASIYFNPFTINVGVIPVRFQPVVHLKIGTTVISDAAVINRFNQNHTFKAGIQYYKETGWQSYCENTKSMEVHIPSPIVTSNVNGYIKPVIELLVYNIAGPYCGVKINGKSNANPGINPNWTILRGMDFLLGVKIDVLTWNFFKDWTILSNESIVAQASSDPPTINIISLKSINPTNVTCEWEITKRGTANILTRGICWNKTGMPKVEDYKVSESGSLGSFINVANNLDQNTRYYFRSYCITNDNVVHYSTNQITCKTTTSPFTDLRDNNIYPTIGMGNLIWFAKNLMYLPQVNSKLDYSATVPKYYVYDFNGDIVNNAKETLNYSKYGVLYNYEASKIACPPDWRLPTLEEFENFPSFLYNWGKELKSVYGWLSYPGITNTDEYGFNALPSGKYINSSFEGLGKESVMWVSKPVSATSLSAKALKHDSDFLMTYQSTGGAPAYSIRCVK